MDLTKHYPIAAGYMYPAGWLCQYCHDNGDPDEVGPDVGADPSAPHPPILPGSGECMWCGREGQDGLADRCERTAELEEHV